MQIETMVQRLQDDVVLYTRTVLFRELTEHQRRLLSHDGSIVFITPNRTETRTANYRALNEVVTEEDREVLYLSPNPVAVRGSIQLLLDDVDRSVLSEEQFGIERYTEQEIEFENGSRIRAKRIDDGGDRLRGMHPDFVVIDNWTEEGYMIDEEVKKSVIAPIIGDESVDLWMNMEAPTDSDSLFKQSIRMGAFVYSME